MPIETHKIQIIYLLYKVLPLIFKNYVIEYINAKEEEKLFKYYILQEIIVNVCGIRNIKWSPITSSIENTLAAKQVINFIEKYHL